MVPRSYRKKDYRNKSLPLIGLGLLLVLLSVCARAQFSGVHQPIFGNSPTGFPLPSGVGYWWSSTDLSTSPVSIWVDRIQGVNLFQTGSTNLPTWSTNGVRFNGISQWMDITNTVRIDSDGPLDLLFFMGSQDQLGANGWIIEGDHGTDDAFINWRFDNRWNIQAAPIAGSPVNVNKTILVAGSTNGSPSRVFTNGIFAINATAGDANFVRVGKNNNSDANFFKGTVSEIIIWTNKVGMTDTEVAQVFTYATNTHPASVTSASLIPVVDYDVNEMGGNDGDLISTLPDQEYGFNLWSSGSARPYYTNDPALLNNQGFLVFDGSSDFMQNSQVIVSQPITIYQVCKSVADATATSKVYYDSTNNAGEPGVLAMFSLSGSTFIGAGGGTYISIANFAPRWEIITTVYNGASSAVYTNNIQYLAGSISSNPLRGLTVGASRALAGFAEVQLAKFVVYNAAHSDLQRSNIVWGLNQRFSIH